MALAAPFLANNLPWWVSGPAGTSSPLLLDFLFPLEPLDRFYNCLLLALVLAGAGWRLKPKGPLQPLDAKPFFSPGVSSLLFAGLLLALYLVSWKVGGRNVQVNYRELQAKGEATVLFTLVPWGSLEDEPARTDHRPGPFFCLQLACHGGLLDGQVFDFTNARTTLPITIGRQAERTISFDPIQDAPQVSPLHCKISEAAGHLCVEDFSTQGTWINQEKLEGPRRLAHGDTLKLGEQGPWFEISIRRELHALGCDNNGFDVLARIIHGSRVSLAVGFLAMGLALLIGVFAGSVAGYFGGWVDLLVSRIIEIFICFPSFFLILTIIAVAPRRSIFWVMFAIGLTGWMGIARLIRGEVLKVRQFDYIQAARALGASDSRIIFRHILPNAMAPVLVAVTFGMAGAILTETGLGFLGLGVEPPIPSWGELLNQARQDPVRLWWLMLYPGLMIFASVTLMNLVGEGLRDAMDPRLRK